PLDRRQVRVELGLDGIRVAVVERQRATAVPRHLAEAAAVGERRAQRAPHVFEPTPLLRAPPRSRQPRVRGPTAGGQLEQQRQPLSSRVYVSYAPGRMGAI